MFTSYIIHQKPRYLHCNFLDMKYTSLFFLSLFCLMSLSVFAQREKDTIKTEKLIIIKQYSPTLNDAFKIKSKPSVSDSIKNTQIDVNYSIFSVPVASTFTPTKGVAGSVKPQALPYNYQNYARLGAGNFTNILGQFYGSLFLSRSKKLNIDFNHLSSEGGIEGEVLDDDFMDTSLNLSLESSERFFSWKTGIGVDYKRYNWYGVDLENFNFNPLVLDNIDPLQTYLGLHGFGQLDFNESIIKNIKLDFNNFTDDYNSSENQVSLNTDFNFFIQNQVLDFNLDLNYLSGSFDQNYSLPDAEINYGFFIASLHPNYQYETGNLTLDIGLKATLLNDTELSETEVFVYPKLNASYKFSEEFMIYAGADGDLNQNSYRNTVDKNPFVSPTLFLLPTDNAITGYSGFSGKLNSLSYNFKAFYKQENNYAFFIENPTSIALTPLIPQDNFEFSNSFSLIYDDLTTLGINAEVSYAAFDDFNIGLSGQYFNYTVDRFNEASYLPEYKVNLNANYQIGEKWYLHSTLYYVGERESLSGNTNFPNPLQSTTVDGFIDLNFGIDYQLSKRLGVFVTGKNLLDDNYEQWRNFNVQGLQVLGGLSYQFDW